MSEGTPEVELANTGSDESEQSESEESSDSTVEESDSTVTSTDQETKYTEKGTKLDSNPMSALNQQLANERSQRTKYESVLNDPDRLVTYAKTLGLDLTKKEAQEVQEETHIDPSKIETVEDLQKFATQLQKNIEKKSSELDNGLKGFKEADEIEKISTAIKSDIDAVREKYPELNPKSESYNKELEDTIGELFQEADWDDERKRFKGKSRITTITEKVMKIRGSAKDAGSKEAQTVVKDKRRGSVISGGKDSSPDESNMSPTQIIASRFKQANFK